MKKPDSTTTRNALQMAKAFGSAIRSRRRVLKMRQVDLALATGVGRRFLIELERGKPSCQLGRSLLVANSIGLAPAEVLALVGNAASTTVSDLPDLPEFVEEPDAAPTGLL
jgi:transcriptional regulator with XRE-family HTH domain